MKQVFYFTVLHSIVIITIKEEKTDNVHLQQQNYFETRFIPRLIQDKSNVLEDRIKTALNCLQKHAASNHWNTL